MKVLWCSLTPGLYDDKKYGTWVAALQSAIMRYCPDIELGIMFEDEILKTCVKDGVHYYPINKFKTSFDKFKLKINDRINWSLLIPHFKKILEHFKPDVIECFGSEWQYGLVKTITDIPVIIHMQGFRNYIDYTGNATISNIDMYKYFKFNPIKCFKYRFRTSKDKYRNEIEKEIMNINKYFTGRTKWDKNIVKYLSPESTYFHCEEVIRPVIYETTKKWEYHDRDELQLISISCASVIKGNEIILQTAKLLKDFGVKFEWKVTGNEDTFAVFESKTGLRHEDLGIKLLGFIDSETIINELESADFYIHPSIIDNSPNSLCEAQLIGTPVLSSYVGGINHIVENEKTGFFYPYNEPFSLAFLIMNLHKKRDVLEKVSKNEIEVSHIRHNPKRIVETMLEIYSTIIDENKNV